MTERPRPRLQWIGLLFYDYSVIQVGAGNRRGIHHLRHINIAKSSVDTVEAACGDIWSSYYILEHYSVSAKYREVHWVYPLRPQGNNVYRWTRHRCSPMGSQGTCSASASVMSTHASSLWTFSTLDCREFILQELKGVHITECNFIKSIV